MIPHFALLRPELAQLSPYNAGLTTQDVIARYGHGPMAKLGSNENPYGMPDAVRDAMRAACETPHVYPDPMGRTLAAEIAAHTGARADQVILGCGSEDLLNVLARALLRPGDRVVTLYPSFPLHEDYARMMGAEVIRIDLTPDRRIDVDALIAAMSAPVRLVIFANPMNPTGLWLTGPELARVLAAQHPDTVLCLDEAYVEYAHGQGFAPATDWLATHGKPLLILRTLSKAYGLAALRVGYGLCNTPELLVGLNLVRTPFNVNAVAQAAATAALRNKAPMQAGVEKMRATRANMEQALAAMGHKVLPSQGNFLFFDCGAPAVRVADHLIDHGVVVKPWKQPGYDSFVRVSVGRPDECAQFLAALPLALARATGG